MVDKSISRPKFLVYYRPRSREIMYMVASKRAKGLSGPTLLLGTVKRKIWCACPYCHNIQTCTSLNQPSLDIMFHITLTLHNIVFLWLALYFKGITRPGSYNVSGPHFLLHVIYQMKCLGDISWLRLTGWQVKFNIQSNIWLLFLLYKAKGWNKGNHCAYMYLWRK